MCGVPMCNTPTAGHKLQKDANELKDGRWNVLFSQYRGQKWLAKNQKKDDKLNRLLLQMAHFQADLSSLDSLFSLI